jgi:serine/threonine-protein kinase
VKSQFGDYRIERPLRGRHEGVAVYQAENADGVPVLLRVLKTPVRIDSDEYKRFQNQFEALRSLFHPGILPVLDSGEIGGKAYYAAPVASFQTLADHLDQGRVQFEWRDAAEVGVQLADALQHMHDARVLHRDLRLEGIAYDIESGSAQIAEFDLVRSFQLPSLTLQGVKLGAMPQVMPETAREIPLNERSDVYQLAGVLYEMLTGSRAVGLDFLYRSLREKLPSVPEAFDELLARCLAEDPEDRPESASELRDALQELLDGP